MKKQSSTKAPVASGNVAKSTILSDRTVSEVFYDPRDNHNMEPPVTAADLIHKFQSLYAGGRYRNAGGTLQFPDVRSMSRVGDFVDKLHLCYDAVACRLFLAYDEEECRWDSVLSKFSVSEDVSGDLFTANAEDDLDFFIDLSDASMVLAQMQEYVSLPSADSRITPLAAIENYKDEFNAEFGAIYQCSCAFFKLDRGMVEIMGNTGYRAVRYYFGYDPYNPKYKLRVILVGVNDDGSHLMMTGSVKESSRPK